MRLRVLIPSNISSPGKEYLIQRGYEIRMGQGTDEASIIRDIDGCDAVLVRNETIGSAVLRASDRLRVVAKHGVGVNNIDLKTAGELGIWVTNGPLSNTVAVAEHAMLLILACAKRLLLFDKATRGGDYGIRDRVKGNDLDGKTLGVVGTGKIGAEVAKKARYGFNMKVVGYDPYAQRVNPHPAVEYCECLETLFSTADFVSLHLPRTAETQGLVGRRMLQLMKPSAFLINVARGGIVYEDDLLWALRESVIAGAGIDVYDSEPPCGDNPLFALSNVIVTPHNAALTEESTDRMGLQAAQGIHEVLSGQVPTWPIVKPAERE